MDVLGVPADEVWDDEEDEEEEGEEEEEEEEEEEVAGVAPGGAPKPEAWRER
jgi:hypothetical protein